MTNMPDRKETKGDTVFTHTVNTYILSRCQLNVSACHQGNTFTHLNPLGAPMSALENLGPFFPFFLSFFPMLVKAKEAAGEGMER